MDGLGGMDVLAGFVSCLDLRLIGLDGRWMMKWWMDAEVLDGCEHEAV